MFAVEEDKLEVIAHTSPFWSQDNYVAAKRASIKPPTFYQSKEVVSPKMVLAATLLAIFGMATAIGSAIRGDKPMYLTNMHNVRIFISGK